ncbi:MAG TPA: class GN sortase [Alphaproteobacteria bacterium]|nr:class GN sortase [Alphaproteobacteria bacterium]
MMPGRPILWLLPALLAAAAAWQLGSAGWLWAKAELAQLLLARAWERTLLGEKNVRPWSWADTWPVARLEAPSRGLAFFVLAGGTGRTLAFAPGHLDGTPLPGERGRSVIAAHRDSHFRFLGGILPGERLRLQTKEGAWRDFVALEGVVLDARHERLRLAHTGEPELVLVTCYPFNAPFAGSPLRYVLRAVVADVIEDSGGSG